MTKLDEKSCWNPTWIVVYNVAWALGGIFSCLPKEVGLMKITKGQWVPNNLSL